MAIVGTPIVEHRQSSVPGGVSPFWILGLGLFFHSFFGSLHRNVQIHLILAVALSTCTSTVLFAKHLLSSPCHLSVTVCDQLPNGEL